MWKDFLPNYLDVVAQIRPIPGRNIELKKEFHD